jgi:primosomal protein N' (replication factor Y)
MNEPELSVEGAPVAPATPVWQARLAVPAPLGQAFSYLIPPALLGRVKRGARVLCELGRRRVLGVVLDVAERVPDIPIERMKPIVAVVDAEPVLPATDDDEEIDEEAEFDDE